MVRPPVETDQTYNKTTAKVKRDSRSAWCNMVLSKSKPCRFRSPNISSVHILRPYAWRVSSRSGKLVARHQGSSSPIPQCTNQQPDEGAYLRNSLFRSQFHNSLNPGMIELVGRHWFTPSRKMVAQNRFYWRSSADQLFFAKLSGG